MALELDITCSTHESARGTWWSCDRGRSNYPSGRDGGGGRDYSGGGGGHGGREYNAGSRGGDRTFIGDYETLAKELSRHGINVLNNVVNEIKTLNTNILKIDQDILPDNIKEEFKEIYRDALVLEKEILSDMASVVAFRKSLGQPQSREIYFAHENAVAQRKAVYYDKIFQLRHFSKKLKQINVDILANQERYRQDKENQILAEQKAKAEEATKKADFNLDGYIRRQDSDEFARQKWAKDEMNREVYDKLVEFKARGDKLALGYIVSKIDPASFAAEALIDTIGMFLLRCPNPYLKVVGGGIIITKKIQDVVFYGDDILSLIHDTVNLRNERNDFLTTLTDEQKELYPSLIEELYHD